MEADLIRAVSSRRSDNVFSRSSTLRSEVDDEEALKWAALEKLPTYDRLKTAMIRNVGENGKVMHEEIDVTKLSTTERRLLVEKILAETERENEQFMNKLRDRIDKVGIDLPKIEVRFEHIDISAKIHVGSRALPSLTNYTLNVIEHLLGRFHLLPSKKQPLSILKDVSGIIKPSRLTLLLGPPSSGKTSLLLALAGKLDKELKVSGRVTYNGHDMTEFIPQRTSAYISQEDLHSGELTVRETFDFASRCQGVGSKHEMITELSRREKEAGIKPDPDIDAFMKAAAVEGQETNIVTDYVLKILGLDICADTLVGDQMRRGISGGQRKRVTTGEMLVGPAKALFMDEISTGLDSSTTYQIVRTLRQTVHVLDATIVICLLQPAPETFELFDDLILLSEGHIVYQGPRDLVLDFFASQGFECPARKGVADFLQEVTSKKDQEQYWKDTSVPHRYVSVQEFADAFQKFHVGQKLAEELSRPFDKSKSHPAALVTERYALSGFELMKGLLAREVLFMRRNSFLYIFKACQITFMAFVTMTVFIRTKMHHRSAGDGTKYMGAMFFGLMTIMFNGFAELSMTIFRLPVFYKQRDFLFYPAWAYALPSIIAKLPLSLLEPTIWVVMTYYVMDMAPAPGRFFRQWILFVVIHQMASALFRFLAALARTQVIANTFGSFSLVIIFVLGGFLLPRNDIRGWWIWGYWISPMMYGQAALAENEFKAKRWDRIDPNSSPPMSLGNSILKGRGLFTERYWYWLAFGALIGYTFLFNAVFVLALTYLNPPKGHQSVPEEVLEDKANDSLSKRRVSRRSSNAGNEIHASDRDGSKKGMVLPFKPFAITFSEVNYLVDMPQEMKQQGVTDGKLQLLHGISGAFRPGVLTALVGVSGAGKTTLMDVLAGRKTGGYIEGDIRISGYPKKQETFARISGYCEQNDIHSPNVTIYESLVYSAWLRLSNDIDKHSKMMFVDEVMELVELSPLRDSMVGLPGVNGLSTEQRKRLTIAVELVANPSIIFMDEPTSGLDARAAAIVMRTVRNTVDTGRTVVCTIHQPSIDIFEAFDELLLLKRGGRAIYAGSLGKQSYKLVQYFEAIPGVPRITEGYNPATWMLEVSNVDMENKLGVDFADIYRSSDLFKYNQNLIQQLSTPPEGSEDLWFSSQYPLTFFEQCLACLWKQHWSYWRNPMYVLVRLFFTMIIAVMFGTMFWRVGEKRGKQQDLLTLMGAMYAAVLFIGVTNATTVQPVVGVERTVYYRERAAGMYSALPYAFGQVLIELPYVLVQTVLYGLVMYSMMGLEWTAAKFFWFIFFMYFTFLYFTMYGMLAVALTPSEHVAAIVSSGFYSLWNLFSGFLIPRPSIPIWWRWYYWCSPMAWSLYGIIVSQLGDLSDEKVRALDGTEQTIKEFLKSYFGFRHDFLGAVAGVHVGLVLLFAFSFAFCIKKFNFQNR